MAILRTCAVALVAALALASCVKAQSCPITADQAKQIDYSGIKSGCAGIGSSPTTDQCASCTCAFRSAFINDVDAEKYQNITRSEAESLLTACVQVVYQPLQDAGVNVGSLVSLQSCTEIPSCFTS